MAKMPYRSGCFSVIDENAWVVEDLDASIDQWLRLGCGPFFVASLEMSEVRYRTARVPLRLKIAVASAGGVQIELIQQLNDGPSAYRDAFPMGKSGFHHIRRRPVGCGEGLSDYDAVADELVRNGIDVVMEMQFGASRIAYADTRATLGCMLEFCDPSDAIDNLKRLTADAAHDWDGSAPVRMLSLGEL